ncbi:MAG: alpha/beta hydrolase [bacterium]|nr:alpha/beta hydrolase [bacterium]
MNTIIQAEERTCSYTTYFLDSKTPKPVVVICPGGAYRWRSERESAPVAKAFNQNGYHAVVLNYTVEQEEELLDRPLLDLSWAVKHLRQNAAAYLIDPDKIILCGFSAGGHLAASLGVFWADQIRFPTKEEQQLHKPNALILGYPVITAGTYAHRGSFQRLSEELAVQQEYSLETKVTSKVPPCFLWHTMTDASVPVHNSILFATALHQNDVSCEMMLFPKGPHGLSLATKEVEDEAHPGMADPHVARWFNQCIDWLSTL